MFSILLPTYMIQPLGVSSDTSKWSRTILSPSEVVNCCQCHGSSIQNHSRYCITFIFCCIVITEFVVAWNHSIVHYNQPHALNKEHCVYASANREKCVFGCDPPATSNQKPYQEVHHYGVRHPQTRVPIACTCTCTYMCFWLGIWAL